MAAWFLFINHFRTDLRLGGNNNNINERNFGKENNPCTLKDEMSGIRTLQTVCLVRGDIQIIFFPVVCFEIKSLRKHQGSFLNMNY